MAAAAAPAAVAAAAAAAAAVATATATAGAADGSDAWLWIDGGTSFAYLNSCVRYQYDEDASDGAPCTVLMDAAT